LAEGAEAVEKYFKRGPRDQCAFLGYQNRCGVRFGLVDGVLTCWLARRHYLWTTILGLVLGPGLTVMLVAMARSDAHRPPMVVAIAMVLVSALCWVSLSDSLLLRRYVIIDSQRRVVVMRNAIMGWATAGAEPWRIGRERTIAFADIRRFERSTSAREYPDDDREPDIDQLHLFSIELTDGRIVRLLESTESEPIESIAAIVGREFDGKTLSSVGASGTGERRRGDSSQ
jgi:hypothetical protein